MKKKIIFLIPILVFIDAISKWLAIGVDKELIKNFFFLRYTENPGVIFGIFANNKLITILLPMILIVYLFYHIIKEKETLLITGFALMVSGLVGNLLDRFIYGFVIDFIYFKIYPKYAISWFNLADAFVVIGLGLALWSLANPEKHTRSQGLK
ncbi:signal peptidase II [archaeon]|nr:signal peptidase II [archaeon]|tara:strand:- start:1694 stop:2152 length:459 start_codon:yes stop_codon:yes gene_type:complete